MNTVIAAVTLIGALWLAQSQVCLALAREQ
jgi:hypothetical protein